MSAVLGGLRLDDAQRLQDLLGRDPNAVEAAMVASLWSEHCSYRHSKAALRLLPTTGPQVVMGPGQNAGVLDFGCDLLVAAKVESHNHPSAVEPYQGAATGLGGILRDILAAGARPMAFLDGLRFGPPDDAVSRYHRQGVVAGIAGYGNAVGVATIGGETGYAPYYRHNPLVNAMAVGFVRRDHLTQARLGQGAQLVLFGARTGRDGAGGAAFASVVLDQTGPGSRPEVQVGDPFTGKLMLEAALEMVEGGWLEGLQDLGAAGLTSSVGEMAERGGSGVDLDLDAVPRREQGMNAIELLLSESQERMLAAVRPEHLGEVLAICRRYELPAAVVGAAAGHGQFRAYLGGQMVVDLPLSVLVGGAPEEEVEGRSWPAPTPVPTLAAVDLKRALLRLLATPGIASTRTIHERYDSQVGLRTLVGPGRDAALLRLEGEVGVAVSLGGTDRYCAASPWRGGAIAVAAAARNVAALGGTPMGLTDCLNFPSPERPEVASAFRQVIEGMAAMAAALAVPVIGGNVSFYNEGGGVAIAPTPFVGMLGRVADVRRAAALGDLQAGDRLWLLGGAGSHLGASAYLEVVHGVSAGEAPEIDPGHESAIIGGVLRLHEADLLVDAHDLSTGGLLVGVAKLLLSGRKPCGARIDLQTGSAAEAFGEDQGRFLLVTRPGHDDALRSLLGELPLRLIGEITADELTVSCASSTLCRSGVEELLQAHGQEG